MGGEPALGETTLKTHPPALPLHHFTIGEGGLDKSAASVANALTFMKKDGVFVLKGHSWIELHIPTYLLIFSHMVLTELFKSIQFPILEMEGFHKL